MGLIRGGFVFILGVLLFVSFLAMNTFATFSSSLSYENVKTEVYPLVQGLAESALPADITGNLNLTEVAQAENAKATNFCRVRNTTYNFSYEGFAVDIPCDVVSLGTGAIINETINDVVYGIYYAKYNCDFWDCFSDGFPFFLISQKAKDYWTGKFWLLFFTSLAIAVLIFLFMENKLNIPIVVGILLALSAIPILKLSSLFSSVLEQPLSFIIGVFFSEASKVFWISSIFAVVLIAMGFSLRIMNLDFMKKLIQKKPEIKQTRSTQASQAKPRKK